MVFLAAVSLKKGGCQNSLFGRFWAILTPRSLEEVGNDDGISSHVQAGLVHAVRWHINTGRWQCCTSSTAYWLVPTSHTFTMLAISTMKFILGSCAAVVGALTANRPGNTGRYTFAVPYDQSFLEGYSILKHVGGLGPYANRASYGVGRDPPDGCAVDQVIMIRRHGERYPQGTDAAAIKSGLSKLDEANITHWRGDLSFLSDWEFFIPDDGLYGLETDTGPYNGLLTSYKHGAEYRVRYGHLWDQSSNKTVPMWTGEFERVIQTARKFGKPSSNWTIPRFIFRSAH